MRRISHKLWKKVRRSKSKKRWNKLSDDLPFSTTDCGRMPMAVGGDIMVSPQNDAYLHRFNGVEWSWHLFGDYGELDGHATCLSNNGKTLLLYDGWDKFLLVIDLSNFKVIRKIKHVIETGNFPIIWADPHDANSVHIIGGSRSRKHVVIDLETQATTTIHKFDSAHQLEAAGCVYLAHKQQLLLFYGSLTVHAFDLESKEWRTVDVEIEEKSKKIKKAGMECDKRQSFGYVFYDDRIIVLGGGFWSKRKWVRLSSILIFDTNSMECTLSHVKCPAAGKMAAVLTEEGQIHLFSGKSHWTLNVEEIVGAPLLSETENRESEVEEEMSQTASRSTIQIEQNEMENVVIDEMVLIRGEVEEMKDVLVEFKAEMKELTTPDTYEKRVACLQQEMKLLAVTVADALKEHQQKNEERILAMERKLQLFVTQRQLEHDERFLEESAGSSSE